MAFVGTLSRSFSTSSAKLALVKTPVQVYGIHGRYATALYSAASKQSQLEAVEQDLKDIREMYKTHPKFNHFVLNPTLRKSEKKAAIEAIAKKILKLEMTANFLGTVAENGRLSYLDAICQSYDELMAAHRGEVQCKITTAKALDNKTMQELATTLQAFVKKEEKLIISAVVDPAIVGGMTVQVGDRYVDMSISTRLQKFEGALRQPL